MVCRAPPPDRYDGVIDASHDPASPARTLELVEPGGRVAWIGLSGSPASSTAGGSSSTDLTVVGVLSGSPGLAGMIELVASGRVDPSPLVAAVVGLDEVAEALSGRRGEAGAAGRRSRSIRAADNDRVGLEKDLVRRPHHASVTPSPASRSPEGRVARPVSGPQPDCRFAAGDRRPGLPTRGVVAEPLGEDHGACSADASPGRTRHCPAGEGRSHQRTMNLMDRVRFNWAWYRYQRQQRRALERERRQPRSFRSLVRLSPARGRSVH